MSECFVSVTSNAKGDRFIAGQIVNMEQLLLSCSIINLFIVAIAGLLLRAFPYLPQFPLVYKNLLHGHSHFAFGGWVMPALMLLIVRSFPELVCKENYVHWWRSAMFILISAYGMLFCFSVQGYKGVSIAFSTFSILASFYMAWIVWKSLKKTQKQIPHLFLMRGLFYMLFSTIGVFATGPLIAWGRSGSALYYDLVYFYLHFQYNGWFLFAILALFYRWIEEKGIQAKGKKIFYLFNISCVPAYFLSVLWHQPSIWFNIIGGMAALVQCIAAYYVVQDLRAVRIERGPSQLMIYMSFSCFVLKHILQLLGALPDMAMMAYLYRHFVIAYLHLVLLGFVSFFVLGWIIKIFHIAYSRMLNTGVGIVLVAFLLMELLIVARPLGTMLIFSLPKDTLALLVVSSFLPLGIWLIAVALKRKTP